MAVVLFVLRFGIFPTNSPIDFYVKHGSPSCPPPLFFAYEIRQYVCPRGALQSPIELSSLEGNYEGINTRNGEGLPLKSVGNYN